MTLTTHIIAILIGFFIAYIFLKNKLKSEANNRKKLAGKYAEKFVPFSEKFPYESADTYYLGMPIDFIIFEGISDGEVEQITFLEIKSGSSSLTVREKSIKTAVLANMVRWKEIRL